MQDEGDGEGELEEETVSLGLLIQASLLKTQASWPVVGESRNRQTSAVLAVTSDFHVGQPHGPSVPRPVADFEGLVWHLIPGVHQGHGDHAIREGDADEHVPVGHKERAVRVQGPTGVLFLLLMNLSHPKEPSGTDFLVAVSCLSNT